MTGRKLIGYRIFLILAAPVLGVVFAARWLIGKETGAGLLERIGRGSTPAEPGKALWVHGASLGEMTAARPMLMALCEENSDLQVIATVNTYTAREMIQNWNDPRISAQIAPLDYSICVHRFCRRWSPSVAITLENEIWPNRLLMLRKLGVPVFALGARMSAKSAKNWAKFPGMTARVLGAVHVLAPLDRSNGARFASLGLPQDRILSPLNLKASVVLVSPDAQVLKRFQSIFLRSETILAASTHDEDEDLIFDAYQHAHRENPNLKLIIAPRHPNRTGAVAEKLKRRQIPFVRRDTASAPPEPCQVLLAGTVGEMPLWYRLAGTTVICGTFGTRGGHTPVEPVQFESTVIHGPDISNQTDAFNALAQTDAAIEVTTAKELEHVLLRQENEAIINKRRERATAAMNHMRKALSDDTALRGQITGLLTDGTP
ncbi:MAG: 3-deoxy-D-manno-octulosonic acid transferase [Marinosulfonomonas sp.]